jgi:hypothetical protein
LLEYSIDPDGVRGLREEILALAGASLEKCRPSMETPVVLIVTRKSSKAIRLIVNLDEVVQATIELCDWCDVQIIDFQRFDKFGQVRAACIASVLILECMGVGLSMRRG